MSHVVLSARGVPMPLVRRSMGYVARTERLDGPTSELNEAFPLGRVQDLPADVCMPRGAGPGDRRWRERRAFVAGCPERCQGWEALGHREPLSC